MIYNNFNFQFIKSSVDRPIQMIILLIFFGNIKAVSQDKLFDRAAKLFNEGQMERSAALFGEAYQYYEKNNHLDSAALALGRQATTVAVSSSLTEGESLLNKSLKLFASLKEPLYDIELDIYNAAVQLYSDMGLTEKMEYFLEKSNEIIEKYPEEINKKHVANFYWDLSYSRYLVGDYPTAFSTAHMSKTLFGEIYGVTSSQYSSALDWLGTLYREKSQYEEALEYAKQSIAIEGADSISTYNLAVNYNNLSIIYNRIGDYKNALYYNDKALDSGRALVMSGQVEKSYLSTFHGSRGDIYASLNKHNESLFELQQVEKFVIDNPTFNAPYLYSNITQAYKTMDSLVKAQDYMDKTWSRFHEKGSGNRDDYSNFLSIDGSLDFKLDRFASSLSKLKEAIMVRDSIFAEPEYYLSTIYENLGLTYCAMDSVELAINAFQSADSISRFLFSPGDQSHISYNLNHAKCLFTHERPAEAIQLLQKIISEIGINPIDFVVSDWSSVVMQINILAVLSSNIEYQISEYERSPSKEQKEYIIKAASNYIEYMERYIGFFDSYGSHMNIEDDYFETLAAVIKILVSDENSDAQNNFIFTCIQKSKSLISRMVLNDVSMNHYSGVPDSIIELELSLRTKLNMTANQLMDKSYVLPSTDDPFLSSERAYRELQEHIRQTYPSYYTLKYDFSVPSLDEVTSALPAGTTYLEYFISDTMAMVILITKDQYVIRELSTTTELLQNDIHKLIHALDEINSNDWQTYASGLFKTLVAPLNLDMTDVDQFIICPDGPMFGLPMELCLANEQFTPHRIISVTSANHIVSNHKETKKLKIRVLGFAPSFTHLKKTDVLPQPFSRSLADSIQSRFEADIYFDQDANEQAFKSQATDYPILHISTHGVLNENDPLSSYLLLYADSLNDGRLTLNELFGMRLQSNLALLNACSTSQGKFRRGVGMNSLAAGFQYAGCRNLISSLWSIDEQANSKIIEYLYTHLAAGSDPIDALFDAKMTYLANVPIELKHPYYWAGISLIGDQVTVRSDGYHFRYILLCVVVTIILLIFGMKFFVRNKKL